MSKRKNISKQDLKNIDLVLENDIQCSGVNIGGRAYEFVSGDYEVLELTGSSGKLTDAQYLDLLANKSIVIKLGYAYYTLTKEDNDYLTYTSNYYIDSFRKEIRQILINKSNKTWNINNMSLQNQPLTNSDVNENLTVVENKASIINGVLYIHFRASATDTISGGTTLVKYNNTLTNQHAFIGLLANSGTTITGFVNTGCEVKLNTNLSSGNIIDIEMSILL